MDDRRLKRILLAGAIVTVSAATRLMSEAADPAVALGISPDLANKAQGMLASGEADLARVRAQIEQEKIPLHEQLTTLEEQLVAAKKRYDERRKAADLLALEASNINTEITLRGDENAYLGNLLDEYVRSFESRIHAGEIAIYEEIIGDTKLAVENPNLTESDRFAKRLELLNRSVTRLEEISGGRRMESELLDPNGVVTKGTMALIGPVAVFSSADKASHGLVAAQAGATRPVLRPLNPTMNAGIAQIIASGEGLLPLDPTRGSALQELIKKTNIIDTFLHGGPIMWPILFCSIAALAISLERISFFFLQKARRRTADIDAIYELAKDGAIAKAVELGEQSRDFVARMLGFALGHPQKSLHTAVHKGSSLEIKRFTRGLWILDTCITMAPLLGLLGTVTGMMSTFEAMGGASDAATGANSVIGGIAEALIATGAGLLIAIMSLIPLNYINDQIEGVQHELDDAGKQLELIFEPPTQIIVSEHDRHEHRTENARHESARAEPKPQAAGLRS